MEKKIVASAKAPKAVGTYTVHIWEFPKTAEKPLVFSFADQKRAALFAHNMQKKNGFLDPSSFLFGCATGVERFLTRLVRGTDIGKRASLAPRCAVR